MNSQDKQRLTDEQKKQNHIESERKRREQIRRGFDALCEVVPGVQGQGRSEAVVLQATVQHLHSLLAKREELLKVAKSKGMTEEEFAAVYEVAERVKKEDDEGGNGAAGPSSSAA